MKEEKRREKKKRKGGKYKKDEKERKRRRRRKRRHMCSESEIRPALRQIAAERAAVETEWRAKEEVRPSTANFP